MYMSVRACMAFVHRFALPFISFLNHIILILDRFPQILNHFFSPLCQNTSVHS